jgi:asparaginyl-tRNA synthetase
MDCIKDSFAKIADILSGEYEEKKVKIRGWVHRCRSSSNLAFIVLRDSTGILQCTFKKDLVSDEIFNTASQVYIESSIMIEGIPKKDDRAPGGWEIQAQQVELIFLGKPFPIAKDQSTEFLLDTRHLWLRSQKLSKIMKLRHISVRSLQRFFDTRGFWELTPPMITKSACEGGSQVFEIDYFKESAYLTESSQMYAEVFIYSHELVYVLAPSFRAEPSRTTRHLSEYWHLEPEMAFYNQEMNMDLQEKMIEHLCTDLATNYKELLIDVGADPDSLLKVKGPFPRMSYEDAIKKCQELGCKIDYGQDLGADEEALLTKELELPIFIHNPLKEFKAFYMREDPKKPGTVLAADMLAPKGHGEIIGGSERIWEYDELMGRINENNMPIENYQWYVDLRQYGSVPHSGFGLGIERLLKWVLNLDHIRDAIPFPRTIRRNYP